MADIIVTSRERYLSGFAGDIESEAAKNESMAYALAALGVAVVLAGVMQLVAGQMRLGRWFRAVSPAVIKGMLSGIGALILISQFHVMFDHAPTWGGKPAHGGLQYLATIPTAISKCFSGGEESHHLAAVVGIVTILTILLGNDLPPRRSVSYRERCWALSLRRFFRSSPVLM